ncbi:hypothetical protein M413DRAFT_7612 [Hebeloma cylindrosporum]|uniref:Uncharacterized protein n=1 Tax=Hebeloma cylindrosporum TaxID=76867 RepID=A0A0C3CS76_HEBCY|nr:hypothetical protein M413DRAFT_7612 [Hebeloma cylindrosporum h7]
MAQYAHALAAERSFPVSTTYYQRADTNGGVTTGINATSLPLQEPPRHGQTNWPGYYTDPQPSPNFVPYVGTSASASSPSYASSWQQNTSQSAVTAEGSSVSSSNFSTRAYHPSGSYEAPFEHCLLSDYPSSSQRNSLPPSSPYTRNFLPLYGFRNDRRRSPSSHTSASDFGRETPVPAVDEHQYLPRNVEIVDEDQSGGQETESMKRHLSTTNASSHTSVKIEPNDPDGCFIMELAASGTCGGGVGLSTPSARAAYTLSLLSQSLAPPTEVPLRATQASKEMKQMMGVFRLNPFAMHSLSVKLEDKEDGFAWDEDSQPPWCGGRPLDEEPLMFEFQLDLNGSDGEEEDEQGATRHAEESGGMGLGAHELSQLRSFSPSFELHRDVDTCDRESLGDDTSHLEEEDDQEYDQDQDRRSESWGDGSYHSEVDTNSTTTTPSVHTPFNDSPEGIQQAFCGYTQRCQDTSSPPVWDPVGAHYQVTGACQSSNSVSATTTLPGGPKMNAEFGLIFIGRLHSPSSLRQGTLLKDKFTYTTTLANQRMRSDEHGIYAPSSMTSSSTMMGDVQHADEPLPPSYMRVIRSRQEYLDQAHHMSARSTNSGASKGVGGYSSSLETNHLSSMVHSHHPGGHSVNRRWSLPETGVMHSGPFLSVFIIKYTHHEYLRGYKRSRTLTRLP